MGLIDNFFNSSGQRVDTGVRTSEFAKARFAKAVQSLFDTAAQMQKDTNRWAAQENMRGLDLVLSEDQAGEITRRKIELGENVAISLSGAGADPNFISGQIVLPPTVMTNPPAKKEDSTFYFDPFISWQVPDNVLDEWSAILESALVTHDLPKAEKMETPAAHTPAPKTEPAKTTEPAPEPTGLLTDEQQKELDEAIEELNELVGLDEIKDQIQRQVAMLKMRLLRQKAGLETPDMSHHMIYFGNPGTGKTTVARIMGKIYHALGVLTEGHIIETNREGLVAEFTGQTAGKTTKAVESAIGGILFVDEAYALTPKTHGSDGDVFGQEALSTLLQHMENRRDDFIVIMAGYTEDMQRMLATNSGLRSRFPNHVNFRDYTPDELMQIFCLIANNNAYLTDDSVKEQVKEIATKMVENADKSFGNARDIRNLFEKVIQAHAERITSSEDAKDGIVEKAILETLTAEDIECAAAKMPSKDKKQQISELLDQLHEAAAQGQEFEDPQIQAEKQLGSPTQEETQLPSEPTS